ncbi:hemerythrin domain-containing protein [Vreelandella populi]|uniref:Hemerythrin domain-containing protein n=1 Tax=Vreelandella populi TaxID=2498858 RepID=A0A3S0WZI0_9GAMM|nr:hemerythrin domain-containing protein [Halomonas populi]RUR38484.1 hemerythrin domain-containing protein [Halomonas populi]RUR43476.1 hemerythrin domain-containing protein [Halomonas populi]RUR51635.1 hemerythrin domain-containing protein [Halomonas populi]
MDNHTQGQSGNGLDVINILTTDHQEMLELLTQVESTNDPKQRRDLIDTAIAEVMRHAVAEEMYVYPAMEKHIPNGRDEVEHDKKEHDELVKVMKKLEDVDASDPSFMALTKEMEKQLRHHIDDEESDQFPKLRTHISGNELINLGEKVENAKKLAPTRPHPSSPHSELFHKSVGPGVGMIDRLLDKLQGRHTG